MNQKKANEYKFDDEMDSMYDLSNRATLKDLCPQDKAKIGKLIKKLAEEKSEKEDLQSQINQTKLDYEEKLRHQLSRSKNQTQTKIKEEINQLDGEISNMLKKTPSQSTSCHQSPNFKQLVPSMESQKKKQELQLLFKQQLSYEASPSFFQSQTQTNREASLPSEFGGSQPQNIFIDQQRNQMNPNTMKTPQKKDNMSIDSQSISLVEQIVSSNSRSSKSKKKEILMAKIVEFEKIVQRMNFSRSKDYESSFDTIPDVSMTQNVYKKILKLEKEVMRIQRNSVNVQQPSSQSNEDDLLIELLNSNQWNPVKSIQKPSLVDQHTTSINSSIYGDSFLSLVDNIEFTDAKQKQNSGNKYSDKKKQIDVDAYAQNVINKYNALVSQLNYDFERS